VADVAVAVPPREEPASIRWASAAFQEELRAWCESHVGALTTMEQHKLRGWATVWRVESAEGVFFAKQNCRLQNFEVTLVPALARIAPSRVVPVRAADHRFLMTPDQGPTFLETVGEALGPWVRLAREAALLQRDVLGHVDELSSAGATTLTVEGLPDYFQERVEQYAELPDDDPRRLAGDVAGRLRALLPDVRRWAEQLGALGLPITLNHNDLHESNVFDVDGRLRFFDFGDALLSDPLLVLLIPLNVLSDQLKAPADDPRLGRVVEAALEVWSDLVPLAELRAALPAALQLARLGRVESWVRSQPTLTAEELEQFGSAAADWLGAMLEPPPYGAI
jgi:hypothetical protein